MGNILYRLREGEVEEEYADQPSSLHGLQRCPYPPRTGFYFGSHFIMGDEKFETGSPETYLFGDNMDLNFLGPEPVSFPYLTPLPDKPTRPLRALVNIRKETLRLIKIPTSTITEDQTEISANIIISSASSNNAFKPITPANADSSSNENNTSNQIKKPPSDRIARNRSTEQIPPNHHELKELPSSYLSTAALPNTSSLKESPTSNPSSFDSCSTTKPIETQSNEELNKLFIASASSTTTTTTTTTTTASTTTTTDAAKPSSIIKIIPPPLYTIEFTFDSDVKCSITIYYLAVEEHTPTGNIYVPRNPTHKTATYYYPMGAGQIFSQPELIFNPQLFSENDLAYRAIDKFGNFDPTVPFPVVIQVNAEEGSEPRQSHSLIATVERNNENQFYMKPFKQKIVIDGLAYLIQEIYGIENKNPVHLPSHGKSSFYSSDEDIEDNGSECVICMSESRDTLILPCRHLCLCNACADSLRYQANNCPICRSPFRALLQFRAIRKINNKVQALTTTTKETNAVSQLTTEPLNTSLSSSSNNNLRSNPPTSSARPTTTNTMNNTENATAGGDDNNDTKSETPPGYESISLIEALNGPTLIKSSSSSRPGDLGLYAFQTSFDDEDVAPLASIEATTKSISGSSQSMVLTKSSRDIRRQFDESSNSSINNINRHSRNQHFKSSSSSLADIRYPAPSSSSSPKLGYRSKSISKSKLLMMANVSSIEGGGGGSGGEKVRRENERRSESLTLWSQQGSPESSSEDQEKVKLLDQGNYSHHDQPQYHHHHSNRNQSIKSRQPTSGESLTSVYIESTSSRSRRSQHLRKRGSLCNDSELQALNSPLSLDSSNQQIEIDSIDGLDINSINFNSTSYPDLFLQDGVDEQRFMDETDMLSVSTLDSVPNETIQQND